MAEEAPPSFTASVEAAGASTGLPPGYDATSPQQPSTNRPLSERVFTLESGKKQPWAFLKVNSRRGSATSIPSFVQEEIITGTVELSLGKTEHIQAVTIAVIGESLSVGQEPIPFLEQEMTLWSTSTGDPGTTGSASGSPKLKGKYVWPFSISLPDKVSVANIEKGPVSEYSLPPSFSERASPAYLEYKLLVTFRRGRLRIDNTLSTSFAFLPRSGTPPPSALRRLAYTQNCSPPGPKGDPEARYTGWEVLGPQSVVGTLFDSRKVEIACMFSLAKPLCYTRGTSIPFALTLSCSDAQALDLFAARSSLAIRLMRSLNLGADAMDEGKVRRTDNSFITCVGEGAYWLSSEENSSPETRKLEGEIPVKGDLKPSFTFPRMVVKYHVSFPLAAPGFTDLPEGSVSPTFSQDVVITTDAAPGPAARSRVGASQGGKNTGDYNVSIGMLTAANQRFVHHHGF